MILTILRQATLSVSLFIPASLGHAEHLGKAEYPYTYRCLLLLLQVCRCDRQPQHTPGSQSRHCKHATGLPLRSMYSHTSLSTVPAGMADCRLLVALLNSALELLPSVTTPALKVTVCMQAALLSAQRHACLLRVHNHWVLLSAAALSAMPLQRLEDGLLFGDDYCLERWSACEGRFANQMSE